MIILTIRTDKPDAEAGLYDGQKQLAYEVWRGHRQLSGTIHAKIDALLKGQNKTWQDLQGVVCFKGPGSFTGLRIGLTVANSLAYGLGMPVVATQDDWIEQGIARLLRGDRDQLALPEYGGGAHITQPRK